MIKKVEKIMSKISNLKNIIILFFAVAISSCATFGPEDSVVPNSVSGYLEVYGTDFNNYELSDLENSDIYSQYVQNYIVYSDPESVWNNYIHSDPEIAWQGRIIEFGIIYDPDTSKVYTLADDRRPCFKPGQIYIINLKYAGFYEIPAAFKITKIDSENLIIEFTYLKNNKSNGFQKIEFIPVNNKEGDLCTLVKHSSLFSSGNSFRDEFIYPPFHEKTINELHKNFFLCNNLDWKKFNAEQ